MSGFTIRSRGCEARRTPHALAARRRSSVLFVHAPVELPNFPDPTPPLGVLKRQQTLVRPVEVVGDVGYLLVKLFEGVA
jgi:hypothetical protein